MTAAAAMTGLAALTALVLGLYFGALAILAAYSIHKLTLLWPFGAAAGRRTPDAGTEEPRPRGPGPPGWTPGQEWAAGDGRAGSDPPMVTVQLPVYNERFVVGRLLDAVGRLDWPADRLEIQVLDDSTDATRTVAAEAVLRLRRRGLDVVHVTREARTGYKAGALREGLARARGEFLLVLDADFLPPRDLIRDLLHGFDAPDVGMVQARWGHLNRDDSWLTRVQALLLDGHFLVEQATRARRGVFFNFNGTAGMWRRSAIEDAGGWQLDTLTEDLDLSYRAQMAGWRMAYLPDVVVPAELPETLAAFKQQQARWAQGTVATAKKILPRLLSGPWRAAIKVEAWAHLTTHVVFPATLLLALLAAPALVLRQLVGWTASYPVDVALGALAILPASLYYRAAARRAGRRFTWRHTLPMLLFAGFALSITATRAVWAGLTARPTPFQRTPKTAGRAASGARPDDAANVPPGYRGRVPRAVRWLELGLAAYCVAGMLVSASYGMLAAAPVLAFIGLGFGAAAARS